MADQPRIDPAKKGTFKKSEFFYWTITISVQFFPTILWYFMFGVKSLTFREKQIEIILKIELITDLGDIDLVERQNGQPKKFCHQTLFSM